MAGSTIGIKIADGSYYPVLAEGFTGTKRLTLTTVKDGQDRVQIDLYRGEGHILDNAQYIGSLIIENIPPSAQGEPEIELILGLDANGELTAEASDRSTGESQTFSIGMRTLEEGETYEVPDFTVEAREPEGAAEPDDGLALEDLGGRHEETFDEVPLTGDTYPVSGADRRRDHLHHRGPARRRGGVEPRPRGGVEPRPRGGAITTILLIVVALALIAALGYVVYRLIWGPPITSFSSLFCPPTVEASATPVSTPAQPASPAATEPAAPATDAAATTTGDQQAAASSSSTTTTTSAGLTYRIRRGDTLWDLSSTYYRNPWLYPVIAKANGIKNPDLIIAGARIIIPER